MPANQENIFFNHLFAKFITSFNNVCLAFARISLNIGLYIANFFQPANNERPTANNAAKDADGITTNAQTNELKEQLNTPPATSANPTPSTEAAPANPAPSTEAATANSALSTEAAPANPVPSTKAVAENNTDNKVTTTATVDNNKSNCDSKDETHNTETYQGETKAAALVAATMEHKVPSSESWVCLHRTGSCSPTTPSALPILPAYNAFVEPMATNSSIQATGSTQPFIPTPTHEGKTKFAGELAPADLPVAPAKQAASWWWPFR